MVFRFLDRYRPFTNGGAVVPSRPIMRGSSPRASGPSPRELALERELAALRREQAVLVREEAAKRANLIALEDRLDALANEIDTVARRTRDPALRENGAAMISRVKAAAQTNGAGRNTQIIVDTIKYALGIGPSPWTGAAPPATSAQPAAVVPIDPAKRAAEIVAAGRKARAETPPEMPSDPTAAGIVRAGKRARNEPTDDDR
jgi:hypothetical protein